jgi:hypothetical protein
VRVPANLFFCIASFPVALAATVCAGCTNAPGALDFRVSPEKETFLADEPVRLRAVLSATGGSVCYGRGSPWVVIVRPVGASTPMRTPERWICGTGVMPFIIPLQLCVVPVVALDVGDGLGRFVLIPRGKQRTHQLNLIPYDVSDTHVWVVVAEDREPTREPWQAAALLPAGRYVVRVELLNQYSWPAPLFWTPYEHPIVATTEFTIIDAAAEAAPP